MMSDEESREKNGAYFRLNHGIQAGRVSAISY
jgi:hypothetical protein